MTAPKPPRTLEELLDAKRREWSETAFDREIVNLAHGLGWRRTSHTQAVTMKGYGGRRVSMTPAAKGFPDRVFVNGGREVVVELKDERNSPDDDQRAWLTEWSGYSPDDRWNSRSIIPTHELTAGIRYVGLWRPRHWLHIVRVFDGTRWAYE